MWCRHCPASTERVGGNLRILTPTFDPASHDEARLRPLGTADRFGGVAVRNGAVNGGGVTGGRDAPDRRPGATLVPHSGQRLGVDRRSQPHATQNRRAQQQRHGRR